MGSAIGREDRPAGRLLAALAPALLCLLLPTPARAAATVVRGPDVPAPARAAKPGAPAASTRTLSRSALEHKLDRAMASAGGASGAWVYDLDASASPLLFADDAAHRHVPASNQKLFTTAAFLDRFGAEHRLETRAYVRGTVDAKRAVLDGDIVLVGDGDPALASRRFAAANGLPLTRIAGVAAEIAASGIERITGKIRADDSIFDRRRRSGPYLPPLSGLSFNSGYDTGGGYARAPELGAAAALANSLSEHGVEVSGRVGRADLASAELKREPLATALSPPVSMLIAQTNQTSNNFFAEMLLKRLAATETKRGTRRRGANRLERFARERGTALRASDGSGLSRRNRVSPREVGHLLAGMDRHAEATAFADSLPIAGREGTLVNRMRGTAAEGRCAAKTGTLSGVSALSGFCEAGAHTIAFSVLMNSVDVNAARDAQDRIAAAIARYRP